MAGRMRKDRREAITALVIKHRRLVDRVVKMMRRRLPAYLDREDLVADGLMGLLTAATRFNGRTKPRAFSTYAWPCIIGAIRDGLRDREWGPRRGEDRAYMERRPEIISLEQVIGKKDGRDLLLGDILATTRTRKPGEAAALRDELRWMLRRLEPMDRFILTLQYECGLTAVEIAKVVGVCEHTVGNHQHKAMKMLREYQSELEGRDR